MYQAIKYFMILHNDHSTVPLVHWSQKVSNFYNFGEILDLFQGGKFLFLGTVFKVIFMILKIHADVFLVMHSCVHLQFTKSCIILIQCKAVKYTDHHPLCPLLGVKRALHSWNHCIWKISADRMTLDICWQNDQPDSMFHQTWCFDNRCLAPHFQIIHLA